MHLSQKQTPLTPAKEDNQASPTSHSKLRLEEHLELHTKKQKADMQAKNCGCVCKAVAHQGRGVVMPVCLLHVCVVLAREPHVSAGSRARARARGCVWVRGCARARGCVWVCVGA